MEHTGEYYLINHLTLFTGLSDRTIRNHIASGSLLGETINGDFRDFHFSMDAVSGVPRGILRGPAEQILLLANRYFSG